MRSSQRRSQNGGGRCRGGRGCHFFAESSTTLESAPEREGNSESSGRQRAAVADDFTEIFLFVKIRHFSMLRKGLFIRDLILERWPLVATRGDVLRFDWLVPYLKSFFEDSNFLLPMELGFC